MNVAPAPLPGRPVSCPDPAPRFIAVHVTRFEDTAIELSTRQPHLDSISRRDLAGGPDDGMGSRIDADRVPALEDAQRRERLEQATRGQSLRARLAQAQAQRGAEAPLDLRLRVPPSAENLLQVAGREPERAFAKLAARGSQAVLHPLLETQRQIVEELSPSGDALGESGQGRMC